MVHKYEIKVEFPRFAFKNEKNFADQHGNEKTTFKSTNTIVDEAEFYKAAAILISSVLKNEKTDDIVQ